MESNGLEDIELRENLGLTQSTATRMGQLRTFVNRGFRNLCVASNPLKGFDATGQSSFLWFPSRNRDCGMSRQLCSRELPKRLFGAS